MSDALATPARLAASLNGRLPPPGAKIGLLGGSFNPAHQGHLDLSLAALKRLGLDEVWWLITPQNPLKSRSGMAPLKERLTGARHLARHPQIRPTDIERVLGTHYTADTLRTLKVRFSRSHFLWLMGGDNLIQLTYWKDWESIFNLVVVAVFDRPTYALRARGGKAARRFADHRLGESKAKALACSSPPAWVFLHQRLNPASATSIRTRRAAASG
ncbi:MAG: nicotinate-nucleotide adenylyltransferase [Pseudomonadota bacterium]